MTTAYITIAFQVQYTISFMKHTFYGVRQDGLHFCIVYNESSVSNSAAVRTRISYDSHQMSDVSCEPQQFPLRLRLL
jgi:regulation of enolase protein 1 (concanavalin A-like superfamily)